MTVGLAPLSEFLDPPLQCEQFQFGARSRSSSGGSRISQGGGAPTY